jgi:GNAT superfamily N-acetyltransferase
MTHQRFTIREATPADLEIILHHRHRMFVDMGYADDAAMTIAQQHSHSYFARALNAGTYRGWLAVDASGRVIGGGGIVLSEKPSHPRHPSLLRADILNVFTEPEHRRRGVARLLVETMIAWCRESGFPWITLHASRDGRPLYEALGFKPSAEMRLDLTPHHNEANTPKGTV